jgi:hypothetical protein
MFGNFRQSNTDRSGRSFSEATVNAVWNKGQIVSGYDPNVWRKDACGVWIKRSEYGQITQYGWEIDHIRPVALGGGDEPINLQPLQWENNRHKGDNWPQWSCAVRAA